jgi:hypothetical protein
LAKRQRADVAGSYDWPLKPFGRQHPVRGFFNDPRIGRHSNRFHFGIDIAAKDGTAVYAVASGTAYPYHGRSVAVLEPDGGVFSYWHIVPAVRTGQLVQRHELLGHVAVPWAHLHLSEIVDRCYRNPLRRGGVGPFRDRTAPTITRVDVLVDGRRTSPSDAAHGHISIVVEAFDTTPRAVPPPWARLPVTPALLRWRVVGGGGDASQWRIGVDFRSTKLATRRFHRVYARGTRQNHANAPGRYRFRVMTGWDTRSRADGQYRLEIEASDTRGNRTIARVPLEIANGL